MKVVENTFENRLQLIFPGKPDEKIRGALKSRGFRWSPSQGCWQRQLTDSARYAAQSVLETISQAEVNDDDLTGQDEEVYE